MSAAEVPRDAGMFDARFQLPDVLSFVQEFRGPRNVHFFDFFSGVGQATKTFRERGFRTQHFDLSDGPQYDITCRVGFIWALTIILSMVPGGLILLGPPCSLWVYMSSSYHGRNLANPEGDCRREGVRAANMLIRNVCVLMFIAHFYGLYFVLEQPSSSQMRNYSWIVQLCQALQLQHVTTWMREFGHVIAKPTFLLSNMVTALGLRRVWSKQREQRKKDHWPKLGFG